MVDALASDRSDQPFGEAVLPRRAWGDGLVADAHGAQSVRDGSAIDAIPIADHVARRLSPRECFGDLACDPVRGRMGYATYYNELRTHRSLNKDAPIRRAIQHVGRIVSAPPRHPQFCDRYARARVMGFY